MKRFVEGEDRRQATLLPECLDDYVTQDNPVRVIEVFIDELDLGAMGFAGVVPEATGRPAYHPATLLKIYLYGYLNRIQSSRRLERETQRNIELMWLTGRLMPDFKTIADFRRDNGPAIRAACAQFVVLCRQLNLFTPGRRGHRREQVQSRQHPRQELHGGQGRQAHRTGRGQHRALSGGARPCGPAGR
jgi:transposase